MERRNGPLGLRDDDDEGVDKTCRLRETNRLDFGTDIYIYISGPGYRMSLSTLPAWRETFLTSNNITPQKLWTDFHETCRVDKAWSRDDQIRFWGGSGSGPGPRISFSTFPICRDRTFQPLHRIRPIQKVVDVCS